MNQRRPDNEKVIDLLRNIRARASTNLKGPDDVDRLREPLLKDATSILVSAETLVGLLASDRTERRDVKDD